MMATASIIQDGDQVVFKREDSTRVFQIRKNREVYFEKSKFIVDQLIGQPYGSTYEIDRGKLIRCEPNRIAQINQNTATATAGADNRNLIDTESNQKMSKDDIMRMKDDGITGEKIIEELIENSETFRAKTEFSQAKYLKKKKKKHMLVFTVLRPTARLVMEIFAKEPAKICYLRPDTLSQLLNYSNIMYGSHVAVVETCQGLVLACLLQRMGGEGKLIQLIPNSDNAVCRQVVSYFSFPKEYMDNVYAFPMDRLSSSTGDTVEKERTVAGKNVDGSTDNDLSSAASKMTCDGSETSTKIVENKQKDSNKSPSSKIPEDVDELEDSSVPVADMEDVDKYQNNEGSDIQTSSNGFNEGKKRSKTHSTPNRDLQRQQRIKRQQEAWDIIENRKLDSLILASKYNPTPILMKMLEFLAPSCPVVVYCQYVEPLVECYTQIKQKGMGLQLRLSETWFREYQVLPQRTHPVMNMSGTGGYLLTFMTAQPETS